MNLYDEIEARPGARAVKRAARPYYGKYPGLVVENSSPSGAHRGEIQVEVPVLLEDAPGDGHQAIRVTAKPSFLPGFFFIPEKGAQVWVEFVAGDINYPIWTGVWHPKDTAPNDSDGNPPDEFKKIIRSQPSGQVLHLDDTDGGEKLVLKDEKNGNTITMNGDGIKITHEKSGSVITMSSDGVVIELSQSKVTLKESKIEIAAGGAAIALDSASGVTSSDGSLSGAQGVVLAPLLDWLLKHTHVGNLGAPTPLSPDVMADLLPPVRAKLVSNKG